MLSAPSFSKNSKQHLRVEGAKRIFISDKCPIGLGVQSAVKVLSGVRVCLAVSAAMTDV